MKIERLTFLRHFYSRIQRSNGGLRLNLVPLAGILTGVMGAPLTVSAETAGVPLYGADFEAPAFTAGSIDGQRGWAVDQGRAEVAAGEGRDGTAGLVLVPLEPFSQARLSLKYPEGPEDGVSFVDLYVRPVAGAAESREEIIDVNSARIGLFRTEDPKLAAVWVFDAAAPDGGQWLRTGAVLPVDESTGRSTGWHRLTLREDAVRQSWDVWVDGRWAAANVGFEEPRRNGQAVYIFMGDRKDVIALDDLSISAFNPLAADADRDGLPDILEIALGSDPAKDDRDEEISGDGVSNLARAAVAGDSVVLARKAVPAAAMAAPAISLGSGLLDKPALATLSAAGGGEIFYTLDGTDPRLGGLKARKYEAPLEISQSTVCRAAVKLADSGWGPVGSAVWIFASQVASQDRPAGWPEAFTDTLKGNFGENRFPVPYGMVSDGRDDFAARVEAALRVAPVVSLMVDPGSFFDGKTGIYHRAGSAAGNASAEVVVQVLEGSSPAPSPVEARVRISGESSRHHETTLKHSLRLNFDPGAVKIPGLESTGSSVLLRHPTQDSWAVGGRWADLRPTARYYADGLADKVLADAGHPHLARRFVHVFLNNCYWGLYEAVDQVSPSGKKGADGPLSADALLHGGTGLGARAVFGDVAPWALLMAQARQTAVAARDGWGTETMWDHLLAQVDVPGLIDYILVNLWLENVDWPDRNWLITERNGKFAFLSWDAEMVMPHQSRPRDMLKTVMESSDGPAGLFAALCWSPAFRAAVEAKLPEDGSGWFRDGAFTATAGELENVLRPLLPAEVARWGAFYEPKLDLMALWTAENAWVAGSWAPGRAEKMRKPLVAYLRNLEARTKAAAEAAARTEKEKSQGPVPFVVTLPTLADGSLDSDGDGLPDAWEKAHGLNPFDPSDALGDPDGDGFSNLAEFRRKTNPSKANPAKPAHASALSGAFNRPDRPIVRHGVVRDAVTAGRLGLVKAAEGKLELPGILPPVPETPVSGRAEGTPPSSSRQ